MNYLETHATIRNKQAREITHIRDSDKMKRISKHDGGQRRDRGRPGRAIWRDEVPQETEVMETIDLQKAVERMHTCEATLAQSVPVTETPDGNTIVWEGVVHAFDLKGHMAANRAYAWSSPIEGSDKRRFFAVLHQPPVTSPVEAVRAAVVAEQRRTMTLKELDEWLPRLYYMAQVLLLFVAILAAFAAYTQFRTFKLFEILKFIEAPQFSQGAPNSNSRD